MVDRKKVSAYFDPASFGVPIGCIVVGAIFLLTGLGGNFFMLLLGLGLVGLGIWLFSKGAAKMSDQEFDRIVLDEVDQLQPRALSRSQLTPDELVPPGSTIVVWGPRFEGLANTIRKTKIGKDNTWRSSALNVAVLHFTQHQLVIYMTGFDLLSGTPLQETTHEYFYRDVVGVTVKSVNRPISLGETQSMVQAVQRGQLGQERVSEVFELTTTGGPAVSFEIPTRTAAQGEDVDQRVQTLRRLLREKKMAIPGAV